MDYPLKRVLEFVVLSSNALLEIVQNNLILLMIFHKWVDIRGVCLPLFELSVPGKLFCSKDKTSSKNFSDNPTPSWYLVFISQKE